ncbi:MAG: hypothetical protein ACWA47_09275 [Brevirhabdus sp.]
MSDPANSAQIEDVLSSIRRLVSEETARQVRQEETPFPLETQGEEQADGAADLADATPTEPVDAEPVQPVLEALVLTADFRVDAPVTESVSEPLETSSDNGGDESFAATAEPVLQDPPEMAEPVYSDEPEEGSQAPHDMLSEIKPSEVEHEDASFPQEPTFENSPIDPAMWGTNTTEHTLEPERSDDDYDGGQSVESIQDESQLEDAPDLIWADTASIDEALAEVEPETADETDIPMGHDLGDDAAHADENAPATVDAAFLSALNVAMTAQQDEPDPAPDAAEDTQGSPAPSQWAEPDALDTDDQEMPRPDTRYYEDQHYAEQNVTSLDKHREAVFELHKIMARAEAEPQEASPDPTFDPEPAANATLDPVELPPEIEETIVEHVTDDERLVTLDESVVDEEGLRELVSQLVREELKGSLGERITRNVRKLVRREIHRALAAREFE